MTALLLVAAFVTGTLFGPSIATAAQSVNAVITNTPLPVSVVAVPSTVIVAQGATSVPYGELTDVVAETDISAYHSIRLTLSNTDAACTEQQVVIYLDGYPSPEFNYFPGCSYVSIMLDTPGTTLALGWFNHDSSNTATAYWNIVGRP
jgi:hypothetical protein